MKKDMEQKRTIEEYLNTFPKKYQALFLKVRNLIFEEFENIEECPIKGYVAYKKKYPFVTLSLKNDGVFIKTKIPTNWRGFIGERLSDDKDNTMNYRMVIHNDVTLEEVMTVIRESYSKTR